MLHQHSIYSMYYNSIFIRYTEAITFDALIVEMKNTARLSKRNEQNINKIYSHIIGPVEMNEIEIGELAIEYYYESMLLNICKYVDGIRYFELQIKANESFAILHTLNRIPNRLSGTQLMTFTNTLLTNLHIKRASLFDSATIHYEGCNGNPERVTLMHLFAIQGKTQGWYERFGFMSNGINQEHIAQVMRNIHNYTLPLRITNRGQLCVIPITH